MGKPGTRHKCRRRLRRASPECVPAACPSDRFSQGLPRRTMQPAAQRMARQSAAWR